MKRERIEKNLIDVRRRQRNGLIQSSSKDNKTAKSDFLTKRREEILAHKRSKSRNNKITDSNLNSRMLNGRHLQTDIECSETTFYSRSLGVYLPTGFSGSGSAGSCSCNSNLINTYSGKNLFCTCKDGYYLDDTSGSCVSLAECNDSGKIGYQYFCMDCASGSTKISGENKCDCSSRTDGKIFWKVNQCIPCEITNSQSGY